MNANRFTDDDDYWDEPYPPFEVDDDDYEDASYFLFDDCDYD